MRGIRFNSKDGTNEKCRLKSNKQFIGAEPWKDYFLKIICIFYLKTLRLIEFVCFHLVVFTWKASWRIVSLGNGIWKSGQHPEGGSPLLSSLFLWKSYVHRVSNSQGTTWTELCAGPHTPSPGPIPGRAGWSGPSTAPSPASPGASALPTTPSLTLWLWWLPTTSVEFQVSVCI